MLSPKDYRQQIQALGRGELHLGAANLEEAKSELARCRRLQRELRQMKKSINMDIKSIRAVTGCGCPGFL